ncbi:MAG: glycosyltransferase involved in cell wall biosynthesis [Psychroserpens sp.]|jgi:glycosyltransferase involved in cell wall biosynthesis
MPKISVLMNCYNGVVYLREALDSLFLQSFTDWELVFVDNCSTDNSYEILTKYNHDKIKYIKTQKNIPLGAARNIGLNHCDGEYITFLDTDDLLLYNSLEHMLKLIINSGVDFAYGGHVNINSQGEIIGNLTPKDEVGYLFPKLLIQFNIPIVSTILSRKLLVETQLNFDKNVTASEEYCLFMQLAANIDICSSSQHFVKYRIHDGALTNKSISKWAEERRYTIDLILQTRPYLANQYPDEFALAFARAGYYDVQYFMSIGDRPSSLKAIKPYKYKHPAYLIIFIMIKCVPFLWSLFQKVKYKRNF